MPSTFYMTGVGRWAVSWTVADGRRKRRQFASEEAARAFTPTDERPGKFGPQPARSVAERFAERYRVNDDGCWSWTHHKTRDGYGQFAVAGVPTLAHRWSYERHVGPIPAGLQIDHLCRNRSCVNPSHLEPVTARQNVRRSPLTQASINASKTHCPKGHPYTEANTYRHGPDRRWRQCRACMNAHSRASQARRRAARQTERAVA